MIATCLRMASRPVLVMTGRHRSFSTLSQRAYGFSVPFGATRIDYPEKMSDPDHVAMLRNGVITEWNAWRKANPGLVPDLFNADLSKLDLASDDATGINLYRANLEHATLIGTYLHGANLRD